jgi:hypothetical protein
MTSPWITTSCLVQVSRLISREAVLLTVQGLPKLSSLERCKDLCLRLVRIAYAYDVAGRASYLDLLRGWGS